MRLTILGSSDAFGSGGRLQTSFHLSHRGGEALIDCGATALIGMARQGFDPNRVSTIFISHLHGDHFAGLVWWLIHAIHVAKRRAPLTVTGPLGIAERFATAAEALFPGCTSSPRAFDLAFRTYEPGRPLAAGGLSVTPLEVVHPSGAPSYGLRLEVDGRTIGFSGDTEWTEALIDIASGADLFISECYAFDREARFHLNWRTIAANLDRLGARRVLLTHMGPEMLAAKAEVRDPRVTLAEDGFVLDL